MILNPGYDMDDVMSEVTDEVQNIIECAEGDVDGSEKQEMQKILLGLHGKCEPYGLGSNGNSFEELSGVLAKP
jgi:hypothetical protein